MSEQTMPMQPKCHCGKSMPGMMSQRPLPADLPGESTEAERVAAGTQMEVAMHGPTECLATHISREWWATFMATVFVPAMQEKAHKGQMVGALIARMGGMVRLHTSDIQKAAEHGFQVDAEPEAGGFITLKFADQLVVPATQMPPGKLVDLKGPMNGTPRGG